MFIENKLQFCNSIASNAFSGQIQIIAIIHTPTPDILIFDAVLRLFNFRPAA